MNEEISIFFEDRFVDKRGTFYTCRLGFSDTISDETVRIQEQNFKSLIGKEITVNGIKSKVLDARVESFCNLVNRSYKATILTDEEFKFNE